MTLNLGIEEFRNYNSEFGMRNAEIKKRIVRLRELEDSGIDM